MSLGAGTRQRILVTVAGRPVSSATAVSPMVKTVTVMPGEMPSMEKKTRSVAFKKNVYRYIGIGMYVYFSIILQEKL